MWYLFTFAVGCIYPNCVTSEIPFMLWGTFSFTTLFYFKHRRLMKLTLVHHEYIRVVDMSV